MKISGKFEVKLQPLDNYAKGNDGITLGRMSIDKTFSGELSGLSKGEMLSAALNDGSAGYVAIEQVTGSIKNKKGSFVLQHFATMSKNKSILTIEVVPGSGTGELLGISGKMSIQIEKGQHYYDFDYQLNEK